MRRLSALPMLLAALAPAAFAGCGGADEAEETVGDAYLEHFEQVEGPLGERDHELMEELEEAISTDLRNDIKAGKTADEIEASVKEIEEDLDEAVEALRR